MPAAWNNMQFACFGGRRLLRVLWKWNCTNCSNYTNDCVCGGKFWRSARRTSSHTQLTSTRSIASGFLFLCLRMWVMAVYENSAAACARWQKHTAVCVREASQGIFRGARERIYLRSGSKHKFQLRGRNMGGPRRNARPAPPAGCNQTQKRTAAAAAIGADEASSKTFFAPIFQDPYHVVCVWAELLLLGVILFSSAELRTLSSHIAHWQNRARDCHIWKSILAISFYSVMGAEPGPIYIYCALTMCITIYPNANSKLNAARANERAGSQI